MQKSRIIWGNLINRGILWDEFKTGKQVKQNWGEKITRGYVEATRGIRLVCLIRLKTIQLIHKLQSRLIYMIVL